MQLIWNYQEILDFLSHPHDLVRRWAFDIIEKRFPRQFTPEVAKLVGDPNEHLACAATHYLAEHKAISFAPDILDCFLHGKGLVTGNCAIALGKMRYDEAAETIIPMITECTDFNSFMGILSYMGKIHNETCHEILLNMVAQYTDKYHWESAALCLLQHHHPDDVNFIMDNYFNRFSQEIKIDSLFKKIMNVIYASWLYEDITDHKDLLTAPNIFFEGFAKHYAYITINSTMKEDIITLITKKEYQHLITTVMFDAQRLFRSRYSDAKEIDCYHEIYPNDVVSLSLLEYFSRQFPKNIASNKDNLRSLISVILTCYLSILHRGIYTKPMTQDASCEDLMESIRNAGLDYPKSLQDRIVQLGQVDELTSALSEDLLSWGDIWVVRLMGKIGDPRFVSDLVRIVQVTEGLSYIHEDAIRSLNAIDKAGHEELLSVLKAGKISDEIDKIALLEHLPYREAFDLAERMWKEDEVESLELYSDCVAGIGDERGIKLLQQIFAETEDITAGDSLEVLSLLHDREIPELPYIHEMRRERQERQERRMRELNEIAAKARKKGTSPPPEKKSNIITFRRGEKVGRNAPCPCGSGKKYKKCCLSKD